jgi:ankyrin repeat protein
MSDSPTQDLRNQFSNAIEWGDLERCKALLAAESQLANCDLRKLEDRDHFTNGHPMFRAVLHKQDAITKLLVNQGSDPDASGSNPDDRPEHGYPLHMLVAEQGNFPMAHFLLDHGATPNSHPNCDQATIERLFYTARESGLSDGLVRYAYTRFLPESKETQTPLTDRIPETASEALKLFARMVDLGGQPPFSAIVRDGLHDLAMEIVEHSSAQPGTPHDHPNSTALNNVFGSARWYGYPELLKRIMDHIGGKYAYSSKTETINVAISSHNRDGSYADYRKIVLLQLEHLKSKGELDQARQDPQFHPIFKIATDFTWHANYGYRAEIAKPECYRDLADLFVAWGFDDINYVHPESGHSPLSAAVKRGHHPGIATYVAWLLEKGADLRESAAPEVNPMRIAESKEHHELVKLLKQAKDLS